MFFYSSYGFLLLSSVFLFYVEELFSISYEAGLLITNSLGFCLSGNTLMSSSFLKASFVRYRIYGRCFLFQSTAFWLHWFLMRNHLLIIFRITCMLLSRFPPCLWLSTIKLFMCLNGGLFDIILLGVHEFLRCVDSRLSSNLGS